MKRLSVIIPVYNAEKHIAKCVDSILPQLQNEDELLLINDGSTDDTISILKELESKHAVIRVIDKLNEGTAKTRNLGIQEAKGEYICFVDNDDFLDSDYIETYYTNIAGTQYDLVMGSYRRCTDDEVLFSLDATDNKWFQLMVVAPWAKIYRRSFLIENKIEFLDYGIGEDIYFNFQVYEKTDKIKIINYQGYNWWFNTKSISNTSQRGFDARISIEYLLDRLYEITGKQKIYDYYYVRYVVWYLLFSGKKATKQDFLDVCKSGMAWLKQHQIKLQFPMFRKTIKGEKFFNKLSIKFFILIYKMGLTSLFASVYCKGNRQFKVVIHSLNYEWRMKL